MLILFFLSLIVLFVLFTVGETFSFAFFGIKFGFFDSIVIGLPAVSTLLTVYSLFFATGLLAFGFLIFISVCCFYYLYRAKLLPVFKIRITELVSVTIISFLLCLIGSNAPTISDSGLYHLSAIKWIENYAVVPGLGNIHGRFAFNPSVFNLSAAFLCRGIFDQPMYVVNPLFSILFFAYGFNRLLKHKNSQINIFFVFLLAVPLALYYTVARINSPTPDLLACLLPVYLFLRFIESENEPDISGARITFTTMAVVVSVYLMTIKLSIAPILLLPAYLIYKHYAQIKLKGLFLFGAISFIVVLPWMLRTYILSGYLIYPLPGIDVFSPDWKIPLSLVEQEKLIVHNYARTYDSSRLLVVGMPLSTWFPVWWEKMDFLKRYLILSSLLSAILYVVFLLRKKINQYGEFWLTSTAGGAFWFIMAPDIRFGFSFLMIGFLLLVALFKNPFVLLINYTIVFLGVVLSVLFVPIISYKLVLLLIFLIACTVAGYIILEKKLLLEKFYRPLLLTSSLVLVSFILVYETYDYRVLFSQNILIKPLPPNTCAVDGNGNPISFNKINPTGFDVYVPSGGEGCYDGPLPCSGQDMSRVQLRGKTISEGFKPKTP